MKDKYVMILEKSNSSLVAKKDGGKYVLEGIFAEFDVENNNKRIYREKEYTPHLEYLKKKIQTGSLLGELDHPEKFDVSLQNASHVIEHLEYVPEKRQVIGRIRLLNTFAGKNAKALIDDGVQLSISSRSAGVVKENKEVEIKRIFTYDLVADPGFPNAQMNRINEQLGFSTNDDTVAIYEIENINFDENIFSNKNDIYNSNNNNNSDNYSQSIKEKNNNDMSKYVTVDELTKYSIHIREKIEEMENLLSSKIYENADGNTQDKLNNIETKYKNLINYTNYLTNNTNKIVEYLDYLSENSNNAINHNDYIIENLNNVIKYQHYLAESLDKTITENNNILDYSNYIATKLDESIQYTEHNSYVTNDIIKHNNYLAEQLNNTIGYTEYIVSENENMIRYNNYLSENINTNNNKIDNIVEYNNYLAENINTNTTGKINNFTSINESNLDEKINKVLESVKKQKTDEPKNNFVYLQLLGEQTQKEFYLLEQNQKQKVIEAVQEIKPVTESQFVEIWNNVLDEKKIEEKYINNLFAEMPQEMKPVWESLNESEKNKILIQATEWHNLQTAYERKMFWASKKQLTKAIELQKLNENLDIESEQILSYKTGYNNLYMNSIESQLDRFNSQQ